MAAGKLTAAQLPSTSSAKMDMESDHESDIEEDNSEDEDESPQASSEIDTAKTSTEADQP